MRVRPVTPDRLVEELADRIAALNHGPWVRVGVDGAPAAAAGALSAALVDPLRVRGHAVATVSTEDFLRPASVRLELGRTDPDSFYEGWYDLAALRREVLDPFARSGRFLPTLWNPAADRATRATYQTLPSGGVLLLAGPLLLGAGLDFEYTVHLSMSAAALARRTSDALRWTLPAFSRYADEVAPETFADVVVRVDDPRHPAVVER